MHPPFYNCTRLMHKFLCWLDNDDPRAYDNTHWSYRRNIEIMYPPRPVPVGGWAEWIAMEREW